jgi:GTPase SAR1 family protein
MLDMWYVNRDVEDAIFQFLEEKSPFHKSRNFVVTGQGGSGKTTLANYIQKRIWAKNKNDEKKYYAVTVNISPAHDLRRTLEDIIKEYLTVKQNLTPAESRMYDLLRLPQTAKNIPLSTLEDFFLYTFDEKLILPKKKENNSTPTNKTSSMQLVVLLDNAHFLLKDRFFRGFITGKGFQSRFSIGIFVTPKSYEDLRVNDPDRVLDRFTLTCPIGKFTFEKTLEIIKKRLEYIHLNIGEFLTNDQVWTIYTSLNVVPRPMMLACRRLFDIYIKNKTITEKDISKSLIDVRLETLDYLGIEVETKLILGIFMEKGGFVESKDLVDTLDIPRASLYLRLNNMVKDRMITPCINQETGEKVRGRWQLDPNMSTLLHFGASGAFVKRYAEQD